MFTALKSLISRLFDRATAADNSPSTADNNSSTSDEEQQLIRVFSMYFYQIQRLVREGSRDEAIEVSKKCASELEEKTNSASTDELVLLSSFWHELGNSLRLSDEFEAAEPFYLRALSMRTGLLESSPDDPQHLDDLAATKNQLGLVQLDLRRFDESFSNLSEALELRERVLELDPANQFNRVYIGGTLCNLGNLEVDRHRPDAALDWYERSIVQLDGSIPDCDCGCRDLFDDTAAAMGAPQASIVSRQFLMNAIGGRRNALWKLNIHAFQLIKTKRVGDHLIATVLLDRLTEETTRNGIERPLSLLRLETIELYYTTSEGLVLDLSKVEEIDDDGVELLLHLRGRAIGAARSISICGLSRSLQALHPLVEWEDKFQMFNTVEELLRHDQYRGRP